MEAKPPWKKGQEPAAASASESVAGPPASKMRRRYQELESLVETQLAKMADIQRQQDSKIAQLEEEMHSVRQFCCTLTSQPEPKRRPQQSGLLPQSEQGQSTRGLAGSSSSSASAASVPMAPPAASKAASEAKAVPLIRPTQLGAAQTAVPKLRKPEQPKNPPQPYTKVVKVYGPGKAGAKSKADAKAVAVSETVNADVVQTDMPEPGSH